MYILLYYLYIYFFSQSEYDQVGVGGVRLLINPNQLISGTPLTIDQVKYINNRVLIPRLEYRLSTTLLSSSCAKAIYTPMTKVAKQAMRLPCTVHTNILVHEGMIGFKTLYQNQIEHHFNEFTIRINLEDWAAVTTLIRLRNFQLRNKITAPLWLLDYPTWTWLNTRNNLSSRILERMITFDFTFNAPQILSDWILPRQGTSILTVLTNNNPPAVHTNVIKQAVNSFLRNKTPIYWMEQCLDIENSTHFDLWASIKRRNSISARGRPPMWFSFINRHSNFYVSLTNTQAIVPSVVTSHPSTDRRRKEWITFGYNESTHLGKILNKSNSLSTCSVQHWSLDSTDLNYIQCPGCSLNNNGSTFAPCSRSIPRQQLFTIPVSSILWSQPNRTVKLTRPLQDFSLDDTTRIPRIQLTIPVMDLAATLIDTNITVASEKTRLLNIYNTIEQLPLRTLEIYTNGSMDLTV